MKGNVGFRDYSPLYARELVIRNFPSRCKRVLDFGCGDGRFTEQLVGMAKEIHACDVDKGLISTNQKRTKKITYTPIEISKKTPYKNGYFDCITLMGVLEHVPDEKETLEELHRILSPNATLFIYVHNKGLLHFLDAANIKYKFPKLHRLLYLFFYGKKAYEKEFVEKRKYGLVGDTSASIQWHTHYSMKELQKLTKKYFTIEKIWYHSFFFPVLQILEFTYISIFKKRSNVISWLTSLDNKVNAGSYSYSVVIQCKRKK